MDVEDNNLVEALRSQSTSALVQLMDRYGNCVYGLVNRVLAGIGQSEDVEECVSDVFLAAWKQIEQYDANRGSLKTWLLILTKYRVLDVRRKLMRRPDMVELQGNVSQDESLEDCVISQEVSSELTLLVNALTEPDRTIFYRRYFYYESIDQISISLSLTSKAVENRLYRLRKMFRSMLNEGRLGTLYE